MSYLDFFDVLRSALCPRLAGFFLLFDVESSESSELSLSELELSELLELLVLLLLLLLFPLLSLSLLLEDDSSLDELLENK